MDVQFVSKNETKEKPVEEILVDKIIRNGSFSKEAQNEILNIAIEIEQAKLKVTEQGKE